MPSSGSRVVDIGFAIWAVGVLLTFVVANVEALLIWINLPWVAIVAGKGYASLRRRLFGG